MSALETLGERLLAALAPTEVRPALLTDFADALGADRAWLTLDDDPRLYTALGCHGSGRHASLPTSKTENERWHFQPLLGPVAQGRTRGMPDRLRQQLGLAGDRIYIVVPMPGLGCLCLEREPRREHPVRAPWSPSQVDAARTAARMLGTALLRQRAEETLQGREERYRLLLDAVSDPIASFGDDDRFNDVNQAFTQLLGHRLVELRGRRLRDLVPNDQHETVEQLLADARHLGDGRRTSTRRLQLLTQRGEAIEFRCRIEAPPVDDGTARLLAIFHDLRADQVQDRIRRQFASLVHHELKTPLTSVVGAARLLPGALERSREDTHRLLDVLTRNASRLSKLIEDLLEFHGLILGEVALQPCAFELASLLQEAAETWNRRPVDDSGGPDAASTGDRITLEPRIEPGFEAFAPPESVVRIVHELLTHAPRLGWRGAVRAEARIRGRGLHLHLFTDDRGLEDGSAPRQPVVIPQDRIDTMGHGEHHGIGLNLIQALAEALGGELIFDQPSVGPCRVILVIPRTPGRPAPDTQTTHPIDG